MSDANLVLGLTSVAGQRVVGPAIVESDTTTILLRQGDNARFDASGWLDVLIDVRPAAP